MDREESLKQQDIKQSEGAAAAVAKQAVEAAIGAAVKAAVEELAAEAEPAAAEAAVEGAAARLAQAAEAEPVASAEPAQKPAASAEPVAEPVADPTAAAAPPAPEPAERQLSWFDKVAAWWRGDREKKALLDLFTVPTKEFNLQEAYNKLKGSAYDLCVKLDGTLKVERTPLFSDDRVRAVFRTKKPKIIGLLNFNPQRLADVTYPNQLINAMNAISKDREIPHDDDSTIVQAKLCLWDVAAFATGQGKDNIRHIIKNPKCGERVTVMNTIAQGFRKWLRAKKTSSFFGPKDNVENTFAKDETGELIALVVNDFDYKVLNGPKATDDKVNNPQYWTDYLKRDRDTIDDVSSRHSSTLGTPVGVND